MKHLGPPSGGGPGADREFRSARQRPRTRSGAGRASPTSPPPSTEPVAILVAPAARRRGGHNDRYEARLHGRLITSSRTPFLDAARALLAEGHDPAAVLVMRRTGSDTDCLISTVGAAAKLAVDEHNCCFGRWKPFSRSAVASRMAPPGRAASPALGDRTK